MLKSKCILIHNFFFHYSIKPQFCPLKKDINQYFAWFLIISLSFSWVSIKNPCNKNNKNSFCILFVALKTSLILPNYFRKLSFKILKLTVTVMYNITAPFFQNLYTLALVSRVWRLDDVHLLTRSGHVVALQGKYYDYYVEPDIRLMNIQIAVRNFFSFLFFGDCLIYFHKINHRSAVAREEILFNTIQSFRHFKSQPKILIDFKVPYISTLLGNSMINLNSIKTASPWTLLPAFSSNSKFFYKSPEFQVDDNFFVRAFETKFWVAAFATNLALMIAGVVFYSIMKKDKVLAIFVGIFGFAGQGE